MRLLTGPAGSGKTTFVLNALRGALRAGDERVRLLVPTATLARHLQNQIAREGFVFHRALIQTLSTFVEGWAGEGRQAPDAVLYLIVEDAARRVNRAEFARVVEMPGFCARLARTIAEFSAAGCDSARLAGCLPGAPLAEAFLAVYREVDRELEARGLVLRAKRLERAAERIESEGVGGIRTIWLDGFHALPDPELRVIGALSRHADLTLTLTDTDLTPATRERLNAMGFREERAGRVRTAPAIAVVRASGIEREAEEIARRILEQAAAGRQFREMAVIVRTPETYVPVLRSALERFGIPANFYFDAKLNEHAAIRFLTGVVDAMLGGWDHAKTLAVLRLAPRFADSNAVDRFDFAVREQIPNAGLGALKALVAGSEALEHKIDSLAGIEEWRSFALTPKNWAARLRTLRNLFRPARPEWTQVHVPAEVGRGQAEALAAFDEALEEGAEALDPKHEAPLETFWRAVKSVLRLKPLRVEDGRRDVVHVLSAHESRQWVLPVVFVCGMVERQFPQFHPQDPFFPDAAHARLNANGIRVRTAAEFEREERALFDSAITRATMAVTLSYPEFDERGERNLRSLFVEDLLVDEQEARAVRPQPRSFRGAGAGTVGGIRAPELLKVLREQSGTLQPTALESYLQCPFQYFGRKTLRLKNPPARPEKRLDFLTQGNIVHDVLKQWYAHPQDIAALFESVFERFLEEKQIQPGYHTERLRGAMLDDLEAFAASDKWEREKYRSRMEEPFEFALDDSLKIAGKIDRLDEAEDGTAFVFDYKYSNAQNTRSRVDDENLLQAPLYLMAAERVFSLRPGGMYYIGLKGGVEYAGWKVEEKPPDWLERARLTTLSIVEEIRAGRIDVVPADPDKCRFCDYRDVCRVETGGAAVEAEGAWTK